MSENIQSISQGTYTIGQTSATNFVAGPGIKIDEPSAGTVRIGNDETVLWSGSRTSACSLSENAYNFDYLQVHFEIFLYHYKWIPSSGSGFLEKEIAFFYFSFHTSLSPPISNKILAINM